MIYSAYCVPARNGTFNLCIFLEGFDDEDQAERFLDALMSPLQDSHFEISATIH